MSSFIYEYKCPGCLTRITSSRRGDRLRTYCAQCDATTEHRRVFSVSIHRPMMEHMNATTGSLISDNRQFKDELKRMSEVQTLKTGIEHQYEPIDHDAVKSKVTGEGLDSTNRVRHERGLPDIKL